MVRESENEREAKEKNRESRRMGGGQMKNSIYISIQCVCIYVNSEGGQEKKQMGCSVLRKKENSSSVS